MLSFRIHVESERRESISVAPGGAKVGPVNHSMSSNRHIFQSKARIAKQRLRIPRVHRDIMLHP